MRVDRIKKNFSILLLSSLLLGCQLLPKAASPSPTPRPSLRPPRDELAFEPPLPLKQAGSESLPALHVIASLNSRDRAGHRRLQLYLQHQRPVEQSFYWQVVKLYRNQFDAIWIYTSPRAQESSNWSTQAAWFAPDLPKSFHIPGFKPQAEHDGLYWTAHP